MSYELSRAARLLAAGSPEEHIVLERWITVERSRTRSAIGRLMSLLAASEKARRKAAIRRAHDLIYSPGGEELIASVYKNGVDWRSIRELYNRGVIVGETRAAIGMSIGKSSQFVTKAIKGFREKCRVRLGWTLPSRSVSDFSVKRGAEKPVERSREPRVWPWRVIRPDGSIVSYHATLGAAESRAAIVGGRVEPHNAPKK